MSINGLFPIGGGARTLRPLFPVDPTLQIVPESPTAAFSRSRYQGFVAVAHGRISIATEHQIS
jgi:hypothetical protein